MKKIPTLFERVYENHKVVGITDKVYPGMEWVLEGEGKATVKWDGSCCAIINGTFYKRYNAKNGKRPPAGAIPCCEPDPVTGHHPHWVPVGMEIALGHARPTNPADKWFVEAYKNSFHDDECVEDGTYEAVGPHFQGDPHGALDDILVRHGVVVLGDDPRTFDGLREYLRVVPIEGIVFWKDGEPQCKIKRSDFGFEWPVKG